MGNILYKYPTTDEQFSSIQIINHANYYDHHEELENLDENYEQINDNLFSIKGTYGTVTTLVKKHQQSNNYTYYRMKQLNKTEFLFNCNAQKLNCIIEEITKLQLLKKHENIVSYIDSYEEFDKFIFIMDYCDCGTLRERIEFQLNKNVHLSVTNKQCCYFDDNIVFNWSYQILNGLKYIHSKQIYHRDLKPDNIFLNSPYGCCKIGDFGIELLTDDNYFRLTNILNYYSLYYKAPEFRFPDMKSENDASIQMSNIDKKQLSDYFDEKLDIFSYGCIIYELLTLERLIKNPFLKEIKLNFINTKTNEDTINNLITQCCLLNFNERPTCEQLYELINMNDINNESYLESLKNQIVPSLDLKQNFSKLNEKKSFLYLNIEENFKPSSLTCLSFNKNLIILTLNCFTNEFSNSNEILSKILIYTEFGDLLYEFKTYYFNEMIEIFNFKIFYSCFDEFNSHIYLTTSLNDCSIIRMKYCNDFKQLIYDCKIDLSFSNLKPKIFNLIDLNKNFDCKLRYLVFSDCYTNNLVLIKFNLDNVVDGKIQYTLEWTCEVNSLPSHSSIKSNESQRQTIFQIMHNKNEIICLLNDYVTINVFYLKTGRFKRDNKHKIRTYQEDFIQPLCMDSDYNIYSCDGYRLFSLNINTFEHYNFVDCIDYDKKNGNGIQTQRRLPLFSSILYMSILPNGKIVLLQDVVQNENSKLFILKPNFRIDEAVF